MFVFVISLGLPQIRLDQLQWVHNLQASPIEPSVLFMSTDQSHPAEQAQLSADVTSELASSEASDSVNSLLSLEQSEQKYQRLVEGISGDYVIYTHDPDGVITYLSPSIEKVLGFPVKALLGLNWRDLIGEHFVGRELADRVKAEVAAGKSFYNFTVEIAHADGSRRVVEIQQRPLFDAAGQYLSMEGVAKDVTEVTRNAQELKKLKQELEQRVADRTAELIRSNELLRKSEARYRTVVEHQTDFVVRWLPGAIYTFVNEAFCRFVQRTNEELIGWCFLPLIHPEDAPAFEEVISRLNREHPFAVFENRILLPDGTERWTHWTNRMLFDQDGQLFEYQSVGRDITELRTAADTIREKEAHLAHVSRLATMGELVAGIAHEVHQPLHAAKTFSEAARRNLEVGKVENVETALDCTREISDAISRTANIIRRMRQFTHSRPTKFEQLDLNTVVQEATELIAFETRKGQVKLEYNLQANLPAIQGDAVQLEQVCVNFLINAYEAMTETPVSERRLRITTRLEDQYVQLAFRDCGCGVASSGMNQLFEAFYSTKRPGLGMGLALCKSIAEAHGGRVWGEQNEAAGMTFGLELPIIKRQPANQTLMTEQ